MRIEDPRRDFNVHKIRNLKLFRTWVHMIDERRAAVLDELGALRKERREIVNELDEAIASDQIPLFDAEPTKPACLAKKSGRTVLEEAGIRITICDLDRGYAANVAWPPYGKVNQTPLYTALTQEAAAIEALDWAILLAGKEPSELRLTELLWAAGEKFYPDASPPSSPRTSNIAEIEGYDTETIASSTIAWSKGGAPVAQPIDHAGELLLVMGAWEPVPGTNNLAWIAVRPLVKRSDWVGATCDVPGRDKTYAGCMVMVDDVAHVLVGQRFTRRIVAWRSVPAKSFKSINASHKANPEEIEGAARSQPREGPLLAPYSCDDTPCMPWQMSLDDVGVWMVPLIAASERKLTARRELYLGGVGNVEEWQQLSVLRVLIGNELASVERVVSALSDWYIVEPDSTHSPNVVEIALPTGRVGKSPKAGVQPGAKLSRKPKSATPPKPRKAKAGAKS